MTLPKYITMNDCHNEDLKSEQCLKKSVQCQSNIRKGEYRSEDTTQASIRSISVSSKHIPSGSIFCKRTDFVLSQEGVSLLSSSGLLYVYEAAYKICCTLEKISHF